MHGLPLPPRQASSVVQHQEKAMTLKLQSALIATTLAASLSGAASADTLQPLQGGTYTLKEWTASVHYTDNGETYGVVITLAALHGERRVPIRVSTALAPGQTGTVAIGSFDMKEDPALLVIERTDDGLLAYVPSTPARKANALIRPDGDG
jgi:hypothetical protein